MHANKDHINKYSAADIQKYLKGDMSAEDMHTLEKAALDDPFLADAIEGMEQTMQEDPTVIDMQLNDLRRQLAARTASEKTAPVAGPFRWWYAAAAASVVILAGIWIYKENASSKSKELAATSQKQAAPSTNAEKAQNVSAPSAQADSIAAGAPSAATTSDSFKFVVPEALGATPGSSVKTKPAAKPELKAEYKAYHYSTTDHYTSELAANQSQPKPEQVIQPDVAYLKKDTVAFRDKDNFFANTSAPAPKREEKLNELLRNRQAGITLAKDKKANNNSVVFDSVNMPTEVVKVTDDLRSKQEYKFDNGYSNNSNLQNFIKGRVVDQYNNPLSNAALRLDNNRNIYATDQMGYFKIPATTDSVMNVSVNVVGYQPQQFKLNTQLSVAAGYIDNVASNNLRMQANSLALNEAVVVGYGTRKKTSPLRKAPSVMIQDAAPNYGWVLFEQYLQKNKRPPADNPLVTGEVVVSFTVDRKGTLSDFTIEQPLAKGYDEDAIRLIKEGPAWKLAKGRKAKVTVIVRY